MMAGLCGIFLGSLGVHKFMLGYTTPGIILAAITVLTCGIGSLLTGLIGLIEGIIYLSKSDEEFYETYILERKDWF
ncbi:MAG: TM2 domain-containing protein [Pirellulales bacterium]|nr:TM2 domain-containing protein [Pirellulales bacterium]